MQKDRPDNALGGTSVVSVLWVGSVKLTLPLPPNRANQSQGQARWEWKTKKLYIEGTSRLVGAKALALIAMGGKTLPLGPTEVRVTFYLRNLMDDDNLKARLKFPLDALVQAGILVDDKRPHCVVPDPEQHIDRKNVRVEIELVPCKDQTAP